MNYDLKQTLLKVENLNVSYDGTKILRDINFEIRNITRPDTGKPQGQIAAIIGRSGCGKSTLFKSLSGFQELSEKKEPVGISKLINKFLGSDGSTFTGKVLIDNDLHPVQPGEVGVVPQDYPLLAHRTIRGNFVVALKGVDDKEKTINDYASFFDLSKHLDKYPCDLSGGQRQRAAILQQVLAGNKTILADEPFSGLDILMKDKVTELLVRTSNLHEENSLIIVSHDMESACAIADTVYVLGNDGKGEGSTILKTYDLLAMGLAYDPEIRERIQFREILKEIKSIM